MKETADALIQPARPDMAPVGARLIYLTMGIIADLLLGDGDADRARTALQQLFRARHNLFSYEFADVASLDGNPVGLVVTYPVATVNALQLPTAYRLARTSGLPALFRMIVRSWPLMGVKEAEDDEFFIPHLAVLPAFQGRGLGKRLLAHADAKARLAGFNTIALTVEVGNERAIALYLGSGYRMIQTCTFPRLRERIGYNGFHRMAKFLM